MTVEVPPAFHIYYATGWEDPVLRVQALNGDGSPQTPVSAEVKICACTERIILHNRARVSYDMLSCGAHLRRWSNVLDDVTEARASSCASRGGGRCPCRTRPAERGRAGGGG
jgi:hypothetical protein